MAISSKKESFFSTILVDGMVFNPFHITGLNSFSNKLSKMSEKYG
jgi:hypothetical protein